MELYILNQKYLHRLLTTVNRTRLSKKLLHIKLYALSSFPHIFIQKCFFSLSSLIWSKRMKKASRVLLISKAWHKQHRLLQNRNKTWQTRADMCFSYPKIVNFYKKLQNNIIRAKTGSWFWASVKFFTIYIREMGSRGII